MMRKPNDYWRPAWCPAITPLVISTRRLGSGSTLYAKLRPSWSMSVAAIVKRKCIMKENSICAFHLVFRFVCPLRHNTNGLIDFDEIRRIDHQTCNNTTRIKTKLFIFFPLQNQMQRFQLRLGVMQTKVILVTILRKPFRRLLEACTSVTHPKEASWIYTFFSCNLGSDPSLWHFLSGLRWLTFLLLQTCRY